MTGKEGGMQSNPKFFCVRTSPTDLPRSRSTSFLFHEKYVTVAKWLLNMREEKFDKVVPEVQTLRKI